MAGLFQSIIYGLIAGALYALVAIGYSLVYSVLGFINFAHGDLVTLGAYICWFCGAGALHLPLGWAVLVSAILTGGIGFGLGRFALVPARDRSPMCALVVAIGLSIVLQNLIAIVFSPDAQPFFTRAPSAGDAGPLLSFVQVLSLAGSLGSLGLLWFIFFRRTRLGIEIRACASCGEAASALGLRRTRVFGVVFFLGGIFAALAGVAKGLDDQIIVPTFGYALGLRAFISAVIGGIGSLQGAVAGAFLLGMTEHLLTFGLLSSPALAPLAAVVSKDAIALAVLGVALLFRPRGLFAARVEPRP